MTTRARTSWAAVVVVLCSLAFVDPAAACTCVGGPGEIAWPTLDQACLKSDAVVVGRVLTQTSLSDPPPYEGNDVAYVDLEVLKGVKGLAPGAHLRVWDAGFGSSCTHDLRPLHVGTVVAMALARNGPENREYHELMRLKVAPEDYLLRSCGDYMQVLKTDREADAVAARLQDAVRRSPKGPRTTR
jgi:hypothetical protein